MDQRQRHEGRRPRPATVPADAPDGRGRESVPASVAGHAGWITTLRAADRAAAVRALAAFAARGADRGPAAGEGRHG